MDMAFEGSKKQIVVDLNINCWLKPKLTAKSHFCEVEDTNILQMAQVIEVFHLNCFGASNPKFTLKHHLMLGDSRY